MKPRLLQSPKTAPFSYHLQYHPVSSRVALFIPESSDRLSFRSKTRVPVSYSCSPIPLRPSLSLGLPAPVFHYSLFFFFASVSLESLSSPFLRPLPPPNHQFSVTSLIPSLLHSNPCYFFCAAPLYPALPDLRDGNRPTSPIIEYNNSLGFCSRF